MLNCLGRPLKSSYTEKQIDDTYKVLVQRTNLPKPGTRQDQTSDFLLCDYTTLKEEAWLDIVMINEYIDLLQRQNASSLHVDGGKTVHYVKVDLWHEIDRKSKASWWDGVKDSTAQIPFSSKKTKVFVMIVPMFVGTNHWVCTIFTKTGSRVTHQLVDSLKTKSSGANKLLKEWFRNVCNQNQIEVEPMDKWTSVRENVPKQDNFCDCGVFMLLAMERASGLIDAYSQKDIPRMRKLIAVRVCERNLNIGRHGRRVMPPSKATSTSDTSKSPAPAATTPQSSGAAGPSRKRRSKSPAPGPSRRPTRSTANRTSDKAGPSSGNLILDIEDFPDPPEGPKTKVKDPNLNCFGQPLKSSYTQGQIDDAYTRLIAGGDNQQIGIYPNSEFVQFDRLAPSKWLDGGLINAYGILMKRRIARINRDDKRTPTYCAGTSVWSKMNEGTDKTWWGVVERYTLPKKFPFPLKSAGDFVVILPMNTGGATEITGGNHWKCAIFTKKGKHVTHQIVDSYTATGKSSGAPTRLLDWFVKLCEQHGVTVDRKRYWQAIEKLVPQQNNGSDCGIFTLLAMEHASGLRGNVPIMDSYSQADAPQMRKLIAVRLCEENLDIGRKRVPKTR
jgi:hypothetical protein